MIERLLKFFRAAPDDDRGHSLNLACAALLTEIMKADHELDEREYQQLQQVLTQLFGLSENDSLELIRSAQDTTRNSNDLFQFTRIINEHWQAADKFRLLQGLWQVAYSDARLDKYEEYMIRRISELLYIPHSEFIRAKLSSRPGHETP